MPSKIIYTGSSTQIYGLKESESSTRFLNLAAYLDIFLVCNKSSDTESKSGISSLFFYHKNTILEVTYSKQGSQIKALGTEKQISAAEKGLAKKLKQAEVSFEEMYEQQPFRQNEILQAKLTKAVRIKHQQILSNAKNL